MNKDIYIIDTSSIANLVFYPEKYNDFGPYWKNLKILIQENKLKIPTEVFNEASRGHPIIVSWIEDNKLGLIYENDGMYVKLSEVLKNILDYIKIKIRISQDQIMQILILSHLH